ncbi:hypothetical protein CGZ60_06270 [Neisseria animalis]|nr:hypothetical protein CGZ60_06270 [Neisseria animalis]
MTKHGSKKKPRLTVGVRAFAEEVAAEQAAQNRSYPFKQPAQSGGLLLFARLQILPHSARIFPCTPNALRSLSNRSDNANAV